MKAASKEHPSFHYLVIDDLPEAQRVPFQEWMVGQTCPLIESELPKVCAYYWDYERWFNAWVYGDEAKPFD